MLCLHAKVTVVPMALGRTAATKVFTYYPNMPGNATSKPVEKAALQEGCMHAYYFQDYSTHDCQVTTLDHLMSQHAITKIDLLKVMPKSLQHAACKLPNSLLPMKLQYDTDL